MWPKKTEEGYCLLHNCKLGRRQVHEKCTNPFRAGCKNKKRCSYLLVVKKGLNTK